MSFPRGLSPRKRGAGIHFVASGAWVEQGVDVVYEAEEHGYVLFQASGGMLKLDHLLLFVVGV
jgi:hypothetical protein